MRAICTHDPPRFTAARTLTSTFSEALTRRAYCFLVLSLFALPSLASKYEIIFEEGLYPYQHVLGAAHLDNKYLARVTIKRDSVIIATVRGSTLPDNQFWYRAGWFDDRRTDSPSDIELSAILERQRILTAAGEKNLADLNAVVEFFNQIPILPSGYYRFITGRHKEGDCYDTSGPLSGKIFGKYKCHGVPYVPRLLGGEPTSPYDGRLHRSTGSGWYSGGFLRTLNRNKAHSLQTIANGINIHDGRTGKERRDSEGCLTIRPSDWKAFYSQLPTPAEWYSGSHRGEVQIVRLDAPQSLGPVPRAPSSLSVQ
jgi:hypothetical protein